MRARTWRPYNRKGCIPIVRDEDEGRKGKQHEFGFNNNGKKIFTTEDTEGTERKRKARSKDERCPGRE